MDRPGVSQEAKEALRAARRSQIASRATVRLAGVLADEVRHRVGDPEAFAERLGEALGAAAQFQRRA